MVAIVVVVVAAVAVAVPVMMLVTRYIFAVVPIVSHEVHGATAGVVFSAVLCPMPFMAGTHVQVHRLTVERGVPVNHHGTRIDQRRRLWHVTDIDLAEESGLADIDGKANVSRQGWRSNKEASQ
jgi:hypothetical protein